MSNTYQETQHMSIYSKIYYNLCHNGSQRENLYKPKSGLHKHRIIPGHQGGLYEENNITYLTVREHIIAHFLLWKMNKNPNDIRSMKMLGAKLSPKQRQITGEWCRDNKIGFHNATPEQRKEWSMKGLESQKNSGDKNSFYYWSTPEGRKKRASIGGKVGGKKQAELKLGFHQPHIQKIAASLGGKSHIGKIWIHKENKRTRIFPEDFLKYQKQGWKRGTGKTKSS